MTSKKKKSNVATPGGAGDWVIRDGLFYSKEKKGWVKRCSECNVTFYAKRRTGRVCSDLCRQRKSRRLRKNAVVSPF